MCVLIYCIATSLGNVDAELVDSIFFFFFLLSKLPLNNGQVQLGKNIPLINHIDFNR